MPVLKPKSYTPVTRNRNCIITLQFAFEPVQSKAGKVHSFWPATSIQCSQNSVNLLDVARRNFRRSPTFVKGFQATMAG